MALRLLGALGLLACTSEPPRADRDALHHLLTQPLWRGEPDAGTLEGPVFESEGYQVQALRLQLIDGFDIAAALWTPDAPTGAGVLVAQGHFGQGKSAPEAQEIAHRLAARGATVLAVDTPGVEEWETPARQIHFEGGAHNRALLAAGGSGTMALQMEILRRGLDALEARGASSLAAAGASGGAVQAFYLSLVDPRIHAAVMASFPRLPREARAGGCACDQLPGWPGPDPGVLALTDRPTLWLTETRQDRPAGLPRSAEFVVEAGPHSFTAPMQARALDFLEDHLPLSGGSLSGGSLSGGWRERVPLLDLRTDGARPGARAIADLPLPANTRWTPQPWSGVPFEVSCAGTGPVVITTGTDAADGAALAAAGLRICPVRVPVDEIGVSESIATGRVYADRQAGALVSAARQVKAQAVYAVRAWGLPASAVGLPFVVRDPVLTLAAVDPARDPAWVHVPGIWWSDPPERYSGALATGDDPAALVSALVEVLTTP